MRAILINVKTKVVEEIELDDPDTSNELQELVGGALACGWVWNDAGGFPRNILYVNEAKSLDGDEDWFQIQNAEEIGFCSSLGPVVLVGNGVIVGVTKAGESMDTSILAGDIKVEMNDE